MTRGHLTYVCVATAFWALSFGVGTQAVSHYLKLESASDTLIGVVHASYYLGVAGMSFLVPRFARRFGLRCASAGMLLTVGTLIAFPFADGAIGWLLIRFLSGAGCALSLIPLETFVSGRTDPSRRSEMFAYYGVSLTIGGAAGITLGLDCFDRAGLIGAILGPPRNAFFLGAIFPALSGLAIHFGLPGESWDQEVEGTIARFPWRKHFLSFGTAWGQGFLEGGMLAFLSLYLVERGMSESTTGLMMGIAMIGVILFQVPVGWLGDRLGRVPVLIGCYLCVIVGLLGAPICASPILLGICLFVFGACSGAMYPLGLSLLGDKLPAASLARAYSWYMAMECVGSQFGAAIMGKARDLWGGPAMFYVGTFALTVVLALWVVVSRTEAEDLSTTNDLRKAA